MKDEKSVAVVLSSDKIAFLEAVTQQYDLPDIGKAVRILIDHARDNPSMHEAIFSESRCLDC